MLEFLLLLVVLLLIRHFGVFDFEDRVNISYTAQNSGKQSKTIQCIMEQHGEQIYLFEYETDNFIIQGKDLAEIEEKCKQFLPHLTIEIYERNKD